MVDQPLLKLPMSHAVKALIYRDDCSMLLQQRDNSPGLLFPNAWTWFGGLVEPGEDLKDALRRELIEELGCLLGQIEEELFQWKWTGPQPALNHVFPVYCQVRDKELILMEGKAMAWYSLIQMEKLALTPLISEHFQRISGFLNRLKLP